MASDSTPGRKLVLLSARGPSCSRRVLKLPALEKPLALLLPHAIKRAFPIPDRGLQILCCSHFCFLALKVFSFFFHFQFLPVKLSLGGIAPQPALPRQMRVKELSSQLRNKQTSGKRKNHQALLGLFPRLSNVLHPSLPGPMGLRDHLE